jgi:hypothetical protein
MNHSDEAKNTDKLRGTGKKNLEKLKIYLEKNDLKSDNRPLKSIPRESLTS